MEYWEDRNCSKAYLDLLDKEQEAYDAFKATDYSDEGLETLQKFLQEMDEELDKLAPEDFGLSNGDYFVDMSYHDRKLYKIEEDRLYKHSTNDVWYRSPDYSLKNAMGLTKKGKWLRFREAPLG